MQPPSNGGGSQFFWYLFDVPAGSGIGSLSQLAEDSLAYITQLTGLRSLGCSVQHADSAQLSTLSVLTQLSSLALTGLAESSLPAIAELAGASLACTLRHLEFFLDYGYTPHFEEDPPEPLPPIAPISAMLPLCCLGRLSALSVPWEVLAHPHGTQLSCLTSLTSLAVDFHYGIDLQGEGARSNDAIHSTPSGACRFNQLQYLSSLPLPLMPPSARDRLLCSRQVCGSTTRRTPPCHALKPS